MTTYYVIVFLDKKNEKKHGSLCGSTRGPYVFTDRFSAEDEFNNRWKYRGFWEDCYEMWEFDINEEELK